MAIYANYQDCNTSQLGTGVLPCEPPTGVPDGIFLVLKSWRANVTSDDFDNDFITAEIKAKRMIPLLNAIGYEPQDEAAEIFTTNLKKKIKVIDGLPGFAFDFNNGYGFHKAAYSLNSYNQFDVVLAYNNGSVFAAIDEDGNIKGHSAGIVDTSQYMHANGSDPQKTTLMFQLTDANEYNTRGVVLTSGANGFNLSTILGIIDTKITKVSNNAADVVVTVNALNNSATPITGLVLANFRALGTSETIDSVSYDTATKEYTLTFSGTVAGDYADLVIELYDSVDSTLVIESGNTLYQGSSR